MKIEIYDMFVTTALNPNFKVKVRVELETEEKERYPGSHEHFRAECLGEVQSNFLWENFNFELVKREDKEVEDDDDNYPVNCYYIEKECTCLKDHPDYCEKHAA